jgi:glycosyltransferase involved in cell wall biosynthesis
MTDLAVDLAAGGDAVTVVATQGSYLGGGSLPAHEVYQGVDIHRVRGTRLGKGSIPRRLADYLSFYAAATARVARLTRPDLVITLSTPPMLSLVGMMARELKHTRFIYWVQDLYPDVAVEFGLLKARSPATLGFEALSRLSLSRADRVVAIGEVMAERLLQKGLRPERLRVIHNWSDAALGTVPAEQNWFLDAHHLRGKFVVQYSGNMGRGHEFDTLLNAADRLRHDPKVIFVLIGDGAKRPEIEKVVQSRGLSNVLMLPYQKREDLPHSVGAADLCVTSLSNGLEGLIVPSKLYGVMAAGKAVLHFGRAHSEVAQIVTATQCGQVVAHGDVDGAVAAITRLAAAPAEAAAQGARGRQAFLAQYERSRATAQWRALCHEVASR